MVPELRALLLELIDSAGDDTPRGRQRALMLARSLERFDDALFWVQDEAPAEAICCLAGACDALVKVIAQLDADGREGARELESPEAP